MAWQPNPDGLNQLLNLLKDASNPDKNVQKQLHQQLQSFTSYPDFSSYLVYILTQLRNQPGYIRTVAGLLLKNNIRENYSNLPEEVKQNIKTEVLSVVGDPLEQVRKTVGSVITTIVLKEPSLKQGWPNLIQILYQYLDNSDLNLVDGAFNTLLLICEDYGHKLDSEDSGRPLNILIPKFLSFFQSPNENFRRYALSCINHFIVDLPGALLVNLESYLKGIFYLANDASTEVRKRVCQAFVMLVEIRVDYLMPYIRNVIQFMLHSTQETNEELALEACEFWCAIAETNVCVNVLPEFLPALTPVLLNKMIYSDMDMALLDQDDDEEVPDNEQDIKPFILKSRNSQLPQPQSSDANSAPSSPRGPEDDDNDDDTEVSEWNIRKCSAAGLDTLSGVFQEDILPILLPQIQERLNHQDNWKIRESAILALGAVAEGCYYGMKSHLDHLVPYLLALLSDPQPLIRSITCWTLSRYSRWIVRQKETEKYLQPLISGLLNHILDKNKKVQEAACSAFATLEEEAQTDLIPWMTPILRTLVSAFAKYQAKNLVILYDAIGTLAEAVGHALNSPEYVNILLPPLIAKWNQLGDEDRNLLPLLECLTSVAAALGVGFQNFAQPVYQRCLRLIESTLIKQAAATQGQGEYPDKDFMICALDLVSGLIEGLEGSAENLLGNSNLGSLLFECMKDQRPDVAQSAFALVGDLAKHCPSFLKPFCNDFIPLLTKNLYADYIAVCNNASWALGEISIKMGEDMKPFISAIMQKLVPLMNKQNLNRNLLENTAITIGRLGFVCADALAPNLEEFVQSWCLTLRTIRDAHEKDSAFRGLCKMIKLNPNAVVRHFVFVCDAIASWEYLKPDLKEQFTSILHGFKNSMPPQSWTEYFKTFPAPLRANLQERYQL